MDKYECRRLNLLRLRGQYCAGKNSELANRLDRAPSYVSRMLYPEGKDGKRRIADDMLEIIENAFDLPRGWLDQPRQGSNDKSDVSAHLPATTDETSIAITNASASMGFGFPQPEYDQVVDTIRITKSWIHTTLPKITSIDNLAVLTAYGDSMAPTFADGDLLLVDRGVKTIKLDAVYVIAREGELFVKRVRRRIQDGAIVIKSDNPLFGPDDTLENGERESLNVLGRVVWAWSGKKL